MTYFFVFFKYHIQKIVPMTIARIESILFPRLVIFNSGYMGLTDSICFSQGCVSFIASPNGRNLPIGKLAVPVFKAIIMTALYACIGIILRLCSNAKMIWVDAWRIIARVHDYLANWDWPNKIFIGISVGADRNFSRHEENAIPVPIFSPTPNPAGLSFFDPVKENIGRAKDGELIQSPSIPHFIVARAAEFSPNRVPSVAKNAWDNTPNLVCHMASYKSHIICHNHGGG